MYLEVECGVGAETLSNTMAPGLIKTGPRWSPRPPTRASQGAAETPRDVTCSSSHDILSETMLIASAFIFGYMAYGFG